MASMLCPNPRTAGNTGNESSLLDNRERSSMELLSSQVTGHDDGGTGVAGGEGGRAHPVTTN
eukprot:2540093-Rhodomonas_salina.1